MRSSRDALGRGTADRFVWAGDASSTTMAPPASTTSTTTSFGQEDSALVAYAFEQDVWLYDGRSERVERLTSDRGERTDHSPQFRDGRRLTFVSMSANKDDSTLVEVDLASGSRRNLLHLENALWAYDWTADGSTLVYVASVPGGENDGSFRHELRRLAPDGSRTTVRRFDGHATPCTATDANACGADGYGTPWTETGDGWRIDVAAGTVETLPIASTADAAVAPTPG